MPSASVASQSKRENQSHSWFCFLTLAHVPPATSPNYWSSYLNRSSWTSSVIVGPMNSSPLYDLCSTDLCLGPHHLFPNLSPWFEHCFLQLIPQQHYVNDFSKLLSWSCHHLFNSVHVLLMNRGVPCSLNSDRALYGSVPTELCSGISGHAGYMSYIPTVPDFSGVPHIHRLCFTVLPSTLCSPTPALNFLLSFKFSSLRYFPKNPPCISHNLFSPFS